MLISFERQTWCTKPEGWKTRATGWFHSIRNALDSTHEGCSEKWDHLWRFRRIRRIDLDEESPLEEGWNKEISITDWM